MPVKKGGAMVSSNFTNLLHQIVPSQIFWKVKTFGGFSLHIKKLKTFKVNVQSACRQNPPPSPIHWSHWHNDGRKGFSSIKAMLILLFFSQSLFYWDLRKCNVSSFLAVLQLQFSFISCDILGIWGDFHWYRLDSDGKWSHKPGRARVVKYDNLGKDILDPRDASMGRYQFVCFMITDRGGMAVTIR